MRVRQRVLIALCFFLLPGSFHSIAQNITTIAGNHSAGYSGDGGNATSASLNSPSGITISSAGDIYFTDQANNRVRKVTTAGIITTVAGNGTAGNAGDGGNATAANLSNPMAVAVDAAGNIYIADYDNARVRKVNTSGIISNYVGTGSVGYTTDGTYATVAAIGKPTGVAIDGAGLLCVVEQNNHVVRRVNSAGKIATLAGAGYASFSGDGGAATAAALSYPNSVAFDAAGNAYITDAGNNRVRKVTATGVISTIAGTGTAGFSGDGASATAATMNNPAGIAVDASGNVIFADYNNQRIRKIATTGTITTLAGTGTAGLSGDGGAATACTFYRPTGVAVATGKTIITDMGNAAVRQVTIVSNTPVFTGGAAQSFSVCSGSGAASINSYMTISDADAGQTETWTIVSSPAHGTLAGFPRTATSTGGAITPAALTFTPTTGYTGTDTFRIKISDGTNTSTTLITVSIGAAGSAGTISGPSSFCPGAWTTFTSSVSGGTWSSSQPTIAIINSSGQVYGEYGTPFTITYTVTTSCGTFSATKADTVINVPSMPTITGGTSVSVGSNLTLSNTLSGGNWSSSNTAIATVSSAGVVYGVANGYFNVTYSLVTTCATVSTTQSMISGKVLTANIFNFAGYGTGASGYTADGVLADSRAINAPSGIAKDKYGYIYFTEQGNNIVRKVSKISGTMYTIAGTRSAGFSGDGGAATAANLNAPSGIAVDKNGNIYIADQANARIRKITAAGIISTIAGTGTVGYTADGVAAASANIAQPTAVAVDTNGNVYFAEQNNHRIRRISTSGILTTVAGNGSASFSGDRGAATAASISYPAGVSVDAANNIYIADAGNNRIRKVTSAGIISTLAGNGTAGYSGDGSAATAAKLYNPSGVTSDSLGNVYIADRNNNVVRKVTTGGIISTVAGTGTAGYSGDSGPATAAKLYYPQGVLCDSLNLYVADFSNNDIRVIGSVTYNYYMPTPVNPNLNLTVCKNSTAKRLDTLMTISDLDVSTTDIWYVHQRPTHGVLTGFPYSHAATGGALMPLGLFYTPTTGYSGGDTFMITLANYGDSGYIYVVVNVLAPPVVSAIAGAATIAISTPATLTDATAGGVWTSSNTARATATATGVVKGVTAGADTIIYTVTNTCGTTPVFKTIAIVAGREGDSQNGAIPVDKSEQVRLYPNPATEIVTIELPENSGKATVIVLDLLGQMVLQSSSSEQKLQLNLSSLAAGSYLVHIKTEKQETTHHIIVTN